MLNQYKVIPTKEYRVYLTCWRIGAIPTPTPQNPSAYRMAETIVHDNAEVYPQRLDGFLQIKLRDILPAGDLESGSNEGVDVDLNELYSLAKLAVEQKLIADEEELSSSPDADQDVVSTPSPIEEESDSDLEEGDNERDPSYKPGR